MGNISIADQTWNMIEEVNASLQQSKQIEKRGETLVAQQNSSTGASLVTALQRLDKDVILSSEGQGKNVAMPDEQNTNKPILPQPPMTWKALQDADTRDPGLISIIGAVLCLQAKSNSNFWSNLWKQASASMLMEVKFAPIIGEAIVSAYQSQSLATKAQSDQARADGILNLSMFGISMVSGLLMELREPSIESPNDPTKGFKNETNEKELPKTTPSSLSTLEREETELDSQTDKIINDTEKSYKNRAMKTLSHHSGKLDKVKNFLSGWLTQGSKTAQTFGMLSQGIQGFFIDSKYTADQAAFQAQEGQAQAVSKEAEQYAQYYGQDFSRSEDLRQGSSQNIDYAMNILQQAANSITQTVTSMFRG
jgi:hypothetical protein